MPEKKNHHTVPQFHLRGFAVSERPGLVWEYDKHRPDAVKTRSIRKAVCCEPFYYTQEDANGKKIQVFEDALEQVERAAAEIIRDLHENRTLHGIGKLAFYIALLLTRGPSFRDGCRSLIQKRIETSMQQSFDADNLPPMPPELAACIEDGNLKSAFRVNVFPQATLRYLVQVAEQISETLCRKKWELFFSDSDHFVISDNPVIFGPARGKSESVGPGHPDAVVYCPLRRNILACIRPYVASDSETCGVRTASKEIVTKINQLMCLASRRYVYAPVRSEQLNALVKASVGCEQSLAAGPLMATWNSRGVDQLD